MRVMVVHSAYGPREAIGDAARRVAAAGHEAVRVDLYGGATAEKLEAAIALRDRFGRARLLDATVAAVERERPDAIVGFSLGASLAHRAMTRLGWPRRLVLFHGVAEPPARALPGVRIQAHFAERDPFGPKDELERWRDQLAVAGAAVELFRYPKGGHLFTDPGLPDYDKDSSELAWERALALLSAPD